MLRAHRIEGQAIHPNQVVQCRRRVKHIQSAILLLFMGVIATIGVSPARAADSITIESRSANGTPNTPAWTEVSGKWGTSKNKSRVASSLVATNVSICTTNTPIPAFKISPLGLATNTTYAVEVTFGTSSTHGAAPDLTVAVSTEGISASTIPTNSTAFQASGADGWTMLGSITPSTDHPALTFTYVSGTLTKESRWYADAVRFTPVAASR